MNKLGYDFDPKASQPSRLHQFLEELFDDAECRAFAQEVFGLAVTAESRHQVFVVFQGQTAGGKGTLARHLVSMLGDHNTCSIDFDKLSQRFALEEAVDKQLIVMPEVNLP